MADQFKHRLETEHYAHDFGAELSEGETLSNPTVDVINSAGEDVTAEFTPTNATVDGSTVEYTLSAAGEGEQDGGSYLLLIEADTSASRHLVAQVRDALTRTIRLPTLEVSEEGDTSAP